MLFFVDNEEGEGDSNEGDERNAGNKKLSLTKIIEDNPCFKSLFWLQIEKLIQQHLTHWTLGSEINFTRVAEWLKPLLEKIPDCSASDVSEKDVEDQTNFYPILVQILAQVGCSKTFHAMFKYVKSAFHPDKHPQTSSKFFGCAFQSFANITLE